MTAEGEGQPGSPRVLIVDAYGHSRDGLKSSLQIEGCVVATAATSWEAISRIKDGRFDLAIIDLELPPAHGVNMTGWELVQVFRAFQAGAPVVLVTADWQPGPLARTPQLEGVHVVEKPVSTAELRSIVRRLRQNPAPGPRSDTERSGRR